MKKNLKIVLSILCFVLVLLIIVGFKLLPKINYDLAQKSYEKGEKKEAIELYTKSCDGGYAQACNFLAEMYYKGRGVPQDDFKACQFYTKACISGNIACEESKKMLDVQEKMELCEKGDIGSCRSVGFAYANGEGVFENAIFADQYLTKACNGGDIVICKNLADAYVKKRLTSKAAKLYSKACDSGDFASCGLLGVIYTTGGDGIQKDYKKSIEFITKSCEGGIAASCGLLGMYYFEGIGNSISRDSIKANQFFTKSCDGGYADSCKQLGDMYSKGNSVRQDDEKAFDAYSKACKFGNLCEEYYRMNIKQEKTKACENGDVKGCRELGNIYSEANGIEQNYKKAFELYTKACDGNDAEGCSKLGVMYRDGDGTEYNKEKAKQLFEKACNNEFIEGCNKLGKIYSFLYDNPDSKLRSIQPFKKACDKGNSEGCKNLRETYYFLGNYYNSYSYKDIQKAKEYYGKGCDLQHQYSCNEYAILNKQ